MHTPLNYSFMLKELFRIPGTDIAIYSYGIMLVIGALCAIWLARGLARRKGLDPELFVNAGLLALFAGVAGARISHVIENWGYFTRPGVGFFSLLWEAINIRSGGLTYYGGFLLAFPVLIIYAIRKKVPVRVGMDIMAPALMIGLAFGRIGCFFNGCCYGERLDGVCAVEFPYYSDAYMEQVSDGRLIPPAALMQEDIRGYLHLVPPLEAAKDPKLAQIVAQQHALGVHPTQLYSSFTGFLLAALLLAYTPFSRRPGRVFALMLMIEPVTRFLLESLRVEPAVMGNMSVSMLLAIPQFALGILLWWWFRKPVSATGRAAQPLPNSSSSS